MRYFVFPHNFVEKRLCFYPHFQHGFPQYIEKTPCIFGLFGFLFTNSRFFFPQIVENHVGKLLCFPQKKFSDEREMIHNSHKNSSENFVRFAS